MRIWHICQQIARLLTQGLEVSQTRQQSIESSTQNLREIQTFVAKTTTRPRQKAKETGIEQKFDPGINVHEDGLR